MAIPVANVTASMRSALDAEGADYYDDTLDLIPAINFSVEWLISIVHSAFGQKKIGEEIFRDLVFTRVFQTSQFSRIAFDPALLGHDIWTLLSVEPLPETLPVAPAILPIVNPPDSFYRNDVSHIRGIYSAGRLSIEEWGKNAENPFADGHNLEAGEVAKDYGYLNFSDYTSTAYVLAPITKEIEIRPALNKKLCTVRYAKMPTTITVVGQNIEFPQTLFNLITTKALRFIGYKQGDGSTLTQNADQDIALLIQSIQ